MSSRRGARDKWALKKWFNVYASGAFGYAFLGTIPANDEKSILRRTMEVSFFDISKDPTQIHIKLKFQIVRILDSNAYTQFKGLELARDYIRSLVRRGTTRVDAIMNLTTKDGVDLRVWGMVVADGRIKTSQERAIRKIMFEVLEEKVRNLTFDDFVMEAIIGKVGAALRERCKVIYPIKSAEIIKIKVLTPTDQIPLKIPEKSETGENEEEISKTQDSISQTIQNTS